ncbi:MAG: tRNA (adenosine(37)-N6)-threonylcarbamoyltransferase complex dimerization subunit type 1 TsaB [Cyclobacteriaceae bacterium]|nr:MAG: tRNA (adenosine(37)-N6)-threonylcarbamoyltransferase complex dimerization subunit type 1 TsaB [Cyclobacteriaceae bacterium]
MSLIVSIETATGICSVALHKEGKLLGSQDLLLEKSHSTHLAVMIKQLLSNCQVAMSDLRAVAVSMGPGSYTGLRIGVATAKGICYAMDIPLIAINTLRAMAFQLADAQLNADYYCPMIDARRMEVYCMILNQELQVEAETRAQIVTANTFDEWTSKGKVLFFGNGWEKCRELLAGDNCLYIDNLVPSAVSVGQLAQIKFKNHQVENLAYFEPFYLKEYKTTVPKIKLGNAK